MTEGPELNPNLDQRPETDGEDSPDPQQIVQALNSYKQEAQNARKTGPNDRDSKWEENLDLYWNRWDFSNKAEWQAKETLPEVPTFVDRFAAALKEALVNVPERFYNVDDPADTEGDISRAIKRITDVWLSTCGRNQNGQVLGFDTVFEEQAKLGALMACSATATWKNDHGKGRVAVETVDPRQVWLDPTYRNLYRLRQIKVDLHDLRRMAEEKDGRGKPIFNIEQINMLTGSMLEQAKHEQEQLTGHGNDVISGRQEIVLDEYLATVLNSSGEVIEDKGLFVVANDNFLIRGPEPNPFWHKKDWLVFAPLVTAPLSVYGRSYMEDFGSLATTFNELTNMILDATLTSSMNAFALAPDLLQNPEQANSGVSPNKTFLLEQGASARDFMQSLDLGDVPAQAITVWQALKQELQEAGGMNDVSLGQFAPNSRTSATEIQETQQSSAAIVRSIAQTIEGRFLNPLLDLVWKTGIQHVSKDDEMVRRAAGPEMFDALIKRRKELAQRPITFQANGLSTLMRKSQLLRSLLQVLQIISSNELLVQEFTRVADMQRLVELLFDLSNIDMRKLTATEREKMARQVTEPLQERAQQAEERTGPAQQGEQSPARDTARREAVDVAELLGVGGGR